MQRPVAEIISLRHQLRPCIPRAIAKFLLGSDMQLCVSVALRASFCVSNEVRFFISAMGDGSVTRCRGKACNGDMTTKMRHIKIQLSVSVSHPKPLRSCPHLDLGLRLSNRTSTTALGRSTHRYALVVIPSTSITTDINWGN